MIVVGTDIGMSIYRLNWCELRWHCVSTCQFGCATRLDDVGLSLVVMPDVGPTTVFVVFRLNLSPLFPHFTKLDRKIRHVFLNSVIFPEYQTILWTVIIPFYVRKKVKPFFRPLGTMDLFLAESYAQSVMCCLFLSHTMWVRDKIHYVGYASIQCVSLWDGERRNHPD